MSLRKLSSSHLQQLLWYLRTSVFFQGQSWVATQEVRNLPATGVTIAHIHGAGVSVKVPDCLPSSKPYLQLIYDVHNMCLRV